MGADWSLADANNPNGTITVDVRQTFAVDDGAVIQVFETGSSQTDGTAHVRLTFETGSKKYYWINSVVAVGILRLTSATDLSIEAWQVSTFHLAWTFCIIISSFGPFIDDICS